MKFIHIYQCKGCKGGIPCFHAHVCNFKRDEAHNHSITDIMDKRICAMNWKGKQIKWEIVKIIEVLDQDPQEVFGQYLMERIE